MAGTLRGGGLLQTSWREVRHHPSRLVATGLAIMISVGFLVACLTFVATETHSIGQRLSAKTSSSDVIVRLDQDPGGRVQDRLAHLPGAAATAATYTGYVEFASPQGAGQLSLDSLAAEPFRWSELTSGTWPARADEVAVGAGAARSYGLGVGSVIEVADGPQRAARPIRVTGILAEGRSLFAEAGSSAVVDVSYFASRPGGLAGPTLLIKAVPGVEAGELAARASGVLPPDTSVRTSAAETQATLDQITNDAAVFRYLLLVFAGIALLVGAMIIINTFTIVVAQRRRQLGLLRAVGASTAQVRRQLVTEATIIGAVGSAAGVALGLVITVAAAAVTGSLADGLIAPIGQLAAAFGAGVLLTWAAALVPAQRATRVTPLEALRPVTDAGTRRRSTRLRTVVGGVIVAIGVAVIIAALRLTGQNVLVAIGGAMVLAVGILVSAPLFLPAVLRLAARGVGRLGVTSRLATLNLVRNPARAAATCTALMLAVGLIVTLQVGAASLKATTNATLDLEFPVDVTLTNPLGPLAPGVQPAVAAVPGIKATLPVKMVEAKITGAGSDVETIKLAGLGADAGTVVSAGAEQVVDGIALAHPFTLQMLGRRAGDPIRLRYQGREQSFTLRASDVADAGMLVITDPALTRLAPDAPMAAVWAAAADREHAAEVMAGVRKVMGRQPGLALSGSLEQAASINTLLDTLLRVATGLLAVAVAIALIGVGNTLGLSVIERTRESALLRALGLQRRQLRLMLLVEAVLLALVGAVIGIAAGMLFGYVGVAALVKETDLAAVRFSMSVPQTLGVVVITALAGALASVLPGRRAALAAPTAALADT